MQQQAQSTNTGAIGGIVASIAGLIVSLALAPLSLVMGVVVLVFAVRAVRSGRPARGWWTVALVLSAACTLSSVVGTVAGLAALSG